MIDLHVKIPMPAEDVKRTINIVEPIEIGFDGRTIWINDANGCIVRIGGLTQKPTVEGL